MWLEEQTTIGQPALRPGSPGNTKGTEEDQGRDGGTTWIVLDSFVKHWDRVAQNIDQWRSLGKGYVQP